MMLNKRRRWCHSSRVKLPLVRMSASWFRVSTCGLGASTSAVSDKCACRLCHTTVRVLLRNVEGHRVSLTDAEQGAVIATSHIGVWVSDGDFSDIMLTCGCMLHGLGEAWTRDGGIPQGCSLGVQCSPPRPLVQVSGWSPWGYALVVCRQSKVYVL